MRKKEKGNSFNEMARKITRKKIVYLQVFHQLEFLFMLQEAQLLHVRFFSLNFLQILALKILFNFFALMSIFLKN